MGVSQVCVSRIRLLGRCDCLHFPSPPLAAGGAGSAAWKPCPPPLPPPPATHTHTSLEGEWPAKEPRWALLARWPPEAEMLNPV